MNYGKRDLSESGKGLSTTIYTQTSDIEEEINGIFTYDRDEVKLLEKMFRMMQNYINYLQR